MFGNEKGEIFLMEIKNKLKKVLWRLVYWNNSVAYAQKKESLWAKRVILLIIQTLAQNRIL